MEIKMRRSGKNHPMFKDLTGTQRGCLYINKLIGFNKSHASWECICVCGKILNIQFIGNDSKVLKNCSCSRRHNQSNEVKKQRAMKDKYKKYLNESLKRNYEFSINFNQFCNLILQKCTYCEKLPNSIHIFGKNKLIYNGIDRIDNNLGYTEINCVTCCHKCNNEKHSASLQLMDKVLKLAKERNLI